MSFTQCGKESKKKNIKISSVMALESTIGKVFPLHTANLSLIPDTLSGLLRPSEVISEQALNTSPPPKKYYI